MRIIFMGTPEFAVPALEAILEAGHDVVCVYTQPPRAAGRGQKPRPSPVHKVAEARGVPVRHPESLKGEEAQAEFAALGVDVAVVAAYGLILPEPVLTAPTHGCINIHASLLPRWRGAAPIQRAILAGDAETGITIMQMEKGLDTGPMLLAGRVPIGPDTNAGALHDALAAQGGALIVEALAKLADGSLAATPQPDVGVSYAHKIEKAEARIDWSQGSAAVDRQVRAFAPFPGAWTEIGGERVKVLAVEIAEGAGPPGRVLDDRLTVACGEGAVRPTRVQRAGKGPTDAAAFLRGFPAAQGTVLA